MTKTVQGLLLEYNVCYYICLRLSSSFFYKISADNLTILEITTDYSHLEKNEDLASNIKRRGNPYKGGFTRAQKGVKKLLVEPFR